MWQDVPSRADMSMRELLAVRGPCTGRELLELVGLEVFPLWISCRTEPGIVMRRVGRRYLRFDRSVDEYARLSPSIRREFLTYSVIGLPRQQEEIEARREYLEREFARVSEQKREIAREAVRRAIEHGIEGRHLEEHVCCMIAGDVTYGMAHRVERPESSTGRMVRGSDLDVVIVVDEEVTDEEKQALDRAVYEQKWRMLALPQLREELDYVVKDLPKVREQLQFDGFRHMIACKILWESQLLLGSRPLFSHIKGMVQEHGVPAKLHALSDKAARERDAAERGLLGFSGSEEGHRWHNLFFTSDEREEIC